MLVTPYKITAFELEGLEENMNRRRGWERIPKLLSEHSMSMPTIGKLPDGRIETTFELKTKGLIIPDSKVASAVEHLTSHVYEISRRKPKLVTVIPKDPPQDVGMIPLLQAALRCTGGRVPQKAIVRCNDTGAAWQVSHSGGKPLEIDLGGSCCISHFATQGRHICTRRYPEVYKIDGLWHVEDAAYLHVQSPSKSRNYHGPWWTVRVTPQYKKNAYHEPQWVSRYELLWRADQGCKWNSLGIFDGNMDETTEVAHSFAQVKGGLIARYLRVVPLDCHNGGAMRVGVYGKPVSQGRVRGSVYRAGYPSQLIVREKDGDGSDSSVVEFRVTQAAQGINRRLAYDGKGACSRGCPCCEWKPSARRKDLHTKHAVASVFEYVEAIRDAQHEMELDKAHLPRMESFCEGPSNVDQEHADLQLALALSRSLVEVQAPTFVKEGKDDSDESDDGWLHYSDSSSTCISEDDRETAECEHHDWELIQA